MEYTINGVHDQVVVFDANGRFVFSADTEQEARRDLREIA